MKLAAESTDFLCVKSMGPVPAAQQPRMALAANLNPGISGVCIHSRTRLACSSQPPPLRIRPAWNVYCGNLWSIRTAVAQASRSDECPLPNTREDAVEQACDAIAAQSALKKKKKAKQKTKGFSPTPSVKLSVEIPVRDESIEAVAELANDMVNGLRGRDVEVAVIVCAPPQEVQKFEVNAVHLYDAIDDPPLGLLLVMMPRAADIEELEELASSGRGKTIVLVNPQWDPWDPPADSRAFLSNFKVAYSYFPLQVQMLVVRQEAAVLKCALDGSPDAAPWRTFVKRGKDFEQVGRMTKRPTMQDIELILVNASAANSPINRGIKGLRGLLGADKK